VKNKGRKIGFGREEKYKARLKRSGKEKRLDSKGGRENEIREVDSVSIGKQKKGEMFTKDKRVSNRGGSKREQRHGDM